MDDEEKLRRMRECEEDHRAPDALEKRKLGAIEYLGCPWCPYKTLAHDP